MGLASIRIDRRHAASPLRALLGALLLSTAVSGCNCDDGLSRIDDEEKEPAEPGLPVVEEPISEPDPPPPDPVWSLTFTEASPTPVFVGESVALHAVLVDEEGTPMGGTPVAFEVSDAAVALSATEVITDNTGVAEVTLLAGSLELDVTVTATAPFVEVPATVDVSVVPYPIIDLEVHTSSAGRIAVLEADVNVYAFPADSPVDCATISDAVLADYELTVSPLPDVTTVTVGTEAQKIIALGVGYGPTGSLVATGCGEVVTHSPLVDATANVVTVELQQLPSVLVGDYDVLMHVGLGGLLPEPYESTLDFITGLLADPAGYAVYQALMEMDDQTGSSFVRWDVGGMDVLASFDEVRANPGQFPTWNLARDLLADELEAQLGQTYTDVTTVGGDLRNLVTDFEVGARFAVLPDEEAMDPAALHVDELWNDLVFEWSQGCTPGDLACIRRPIALENTAYAPVTTEYAASWTHDPTADDSERFRVDTASHRLALRYGAIILIALDQLVYPSLGADSLASFLTNLIDCQSVGESIADAVGGPPFLYVGFCTTGMTLAANEIEGQLLDLEIGAGDPNDPNGEPGLVGQSFFVLTDRDQDLFTEDVPLLETTVAWVDPADPDVSEEVAAPILGYGRLAASNCTSDISCDAGHTCQPVAHYLEVAAIELDCRRAVGGVLGESNCSADTECASGLCVAGTCYSACADNGACGSGVCSSTGAVIGLDGVLDGLGDVFAPMCVD